VNKFVTEFMNRSTKVIMVVQPFNIKGVGLVHGGALFIGECAKDSAADKCFLSGCPPTKRRDV
jgi:hypothetical protein